MPLLFLLLGVGAVAALAASRKSGPGILLVAPDPEADAVYDSVVARWKAYETALGGKPVPGVADAVAAVDEASVRVQADIDGRVATGAKNEKAFLGAVGFFFGDQGKSYFQRVIDFAKSITGTPDCEKTEERDAAHDCAAAYFSLGAPIEFMSSALAGFYFSNYCQLRGWFCGLRDNFVAQTAPRKAALRAVTQTMITKAPMPLVAQTLRFSLDGFVQDKSGTPAVDAARALPGPYRYTAEYHAAHPTLGETYDMEGAAWLLAAVRMAVAQFGGNERSIFRAVFQETKDRAWQFSKEFPGAILSRLAGLPALTYDYGAGEHHVANSPTAFMALQAEWARLAYLAAQGRSIRGAMNGLIIPVGTNVGAPASGGIDLGG